MEDTVCVQTPLGGGEDGREDGAEEGVEEDGLFAVFDGHQGGEGRRERGRGIVSFESPLLLRRSLTHLLISPALPHKAFCVPSSRPTTWWEGDEEKCVS